MVVLGTGWAGVSFLKNLKSSSYDVEVVSPHNYFLFTPLLPSITFKFKMTPHIYCFLGFNWQGVEDALKIRQSVINCFERANLPCTSQEERKKILHFVVVGGGPAGVEFAAELHDFVVEDLAKLYPAVYSRLFRFEAHNFISSMTVATISSFPIFFRLLITAL